MSENGTDEGMDFNEVFPHTQGNFTLVEIAEAVGTSKQTIDAWCKKAKIRINYVGKSRVRTLRRRQVLKLFEKFVWTEEE